MDMAEKKSLYTLSDEAVVALAQGGDKDALDHIIARYRNCVYSKANTYFLVGAERDDVVQEGLIGLYKAIKEYNDGDNNTHSNEIFEQVLKPMIVDKDYNKTLDNLSRVIFRGHCFGCMVIAELENLLETKLKEQFNDAECKELLSAPQALISSPALQLDKYPKYFETTAIVNNSDRTITNEE